ncbi:hypothetical protein [Chryseobacterium terrae]|uniref:Abi-like protein n=1 Tax=Chryseobacterium terrae TaxID=3163299 RepID=A0ABW8Y1W5_9FLAO
MKLNYIQNGLDSLQKGYKNLIEYENLTFSENSDNSNRFFYLKDAILFTHHGIEILIKKILHNYNELLLFSQIDSHLKNAIIEKNKNNLNSVFETKLNHKIHTVNFSESLERLKIIPNLKLSSNLENKLKDLEMYRNIIMHSEPFINEYLIINTFDDLSDELDVFFEIALPNEYKSITDYDRFKQTYEIYNDFAETEDFINVLKINKIIIQALDKARIRIGINEIKIINDRKKIKIFLNEIFKESEFGCDLYNNFCSGQITNFKQIDQSLFSLYAKDLDTIYEFNLKTIIIYIPPLHYKSSPIIFIESDEIKYDQKELKNHNTFDRHNIFYMNYLRNKDTNELVFDRDSITEVNRGFNVSRFENIYRFFSKGIFCFLNFNKLENQFEFKKILFENHHLTGKQLEVKIRSLIRAL